MSEAQSKKASAYDLGDMIAEGFDSAAMDGNNEFKVMIDLDDIEIEEQVRPEDEFEDDENTLADLGRSLRRKQLQAIVVRPNRPGRAKPYLLVIGGRRCRAARLEGLTQLGGEIRELTDEEAEAAQVEENIHRLNLSQKAEARQVQRDLDKLGSIEAVCAKYNKSRAALSKVLSLLKLPEQTNRLVRENITADVEVIGAVKQVEKRDPQAAKELVDTLKKGKGKVNARDVVKEVKDKVKPPKADKKKPAAPIKNPDNVAQPRDESHTEPGPVRTIDSAELDAEAQQEGVAVAPIEALGKAYQRIYAGADAKELLAEMSAQERDDTGEWLQKYYDAGIDCKNLANAVVQGFRSGTFAAEGSGAYALIAFLNGGEEGVKFNILNILGTAKA